MRIGRTIGVLILTSLLGGVLLAAGIRSGESLLLERSAESERHARALREASALYEDVGSWLEGVDAALRARDRERADAADEKAARAQGRIVTLRAILPPGHAPLELASLEELLRGLGHRLRRAFEEGRESGGFDADSYQLIVLADQVIAKLEEHQARHQAALGRLRLAIHGGGALGLGAYLAGIFLLWRWAQSSLVRPLECLTGATRRALEARAPLEFCCEGPEEVQDLATTFQSLVESLVEASANLERKVQERTRELERASRAKSDFLATMSHELRTPMNGVIGMAGLLEETELGPEQRDLVETVRRCGESLLFIIEDILDFSRIEAGKLDLAAEDLEPRRLVEEVVEMLGETARAKGLELGACVHPDVPARVRGDPARLKQVLLNLAGNALKFTEHGAVRIAVRATGPPGPQVTLRFEVADTGIGIPFEGREKLFEPFVQGDASTSRRFGGTGLGLAICRRLVEVMGGEIGVESEPGHGSLFWFQVRLTPASREKEDTAGRAGAGRAAAPVVHATGEVLALVAEDNPVNRKLVKRLLEKRGFRVDLAADGAEAVAAAGQVAYDVILMDCQMPGVDGFEATRAVRARESREGGRVPVIAVTANAMEGDRERCLEAGMDDYLAKPLRPGQLDAALLRCLPGKLSGA